MLIIVRGKPWNYWNNNPESLPLMFEKNRITMDKIQIYDKTFRKYITYDELSKAIDRVADKINADYKDHEGEPPMFLCVLNGAIMFTSEMMKRLNFNAELISIKVKSYTGTTSSGTVLIPMGLTGSVEGRDVILFEDIVDTGVTITSLQELLISKGARSVKICTMLFKPDVYKQSIKLDYVGMEVPNVFILGFGLDYDELGRNLTDIYILDK